MKHLTERFLNLLQNSPIKWEKRFKRELKSFASSAINDLAPYHHHGHFSLTVKDQVLDLAVEKLTARLSENPAVNADDLRIAWQAVVLEFHETSYWGFQLQRKKELPPVSSDQKVKKELFSYIWAFVQSVIILKVAVYYFGLSYSMDPESNHFWGLLLALSLSVGSLLFFIYRKRGEKSE